MSSLADKLTDQSPSDESRTLSDRAFWVLHEAIVRGALEPGDRLPIDELAQLLNMSPMPIREALRRLDSDGLAENIPHRGARVTELSLVDLDEVYDARLALEPLAVRRAAERFNDDDLALSSAALERHQKAVEQDALDEAWSAHSDFHLSLYRAADSRWLMRLIMPLWQSSERYRHASGLVDWHLTEREAEHREILNACANHDPDGAARALHNHLVLTANVVSHSMGGKDLFEPLPAPGAAKAKKARPSATR